jgi:hypothetical protein
VGKPEGKGHLGRPRCRWKVIIKNDLRDMGCGGMEWINLGEYRDQYVALDNMVRDLQIPQNFGKFFNS